MNTDSDSRRLLAGLPPERRQAVLDAARNTPGLVLSEGALKTTLTVENVLHRGEGEARAPDKPKWWLRHYLDPRLRGLIAMFKARPVE